MKPVFRVIPVVFPLSLMLASCLVDDTAEVVAEAEQALDPAVASVQLSPSTIAGGSNGTSTGTVTLAAPAPAGGVVVSLASSLPIWRSG